MRSIPEIIEEMQAVKEEMRFPTFNYREGELEIVLTRLRFELGAAKDRDYDERHGR